MRLFVTQSARTTPFRKAGRYLCLDYFYRLVAAWRIRYGDGGTGHFVHFR